jgi:hypothetical protein
LGSESYSTEVLRMLFKLVGGRANADEFGEAREIARLLNV